MTAAALVALADELRATRARLAEEERKVRVQARRAAAHERIVATARGGSKRGGAVFVTTGAAS